MFVYMIINDVNGMYYVGKTVQKNLQRYFMGQLSCAMAGYKTKPYLYNAIRKHGRQNFRVHALIDTLKTNEELCRWESKLIGLFRAQDRSIGYNIEDGGEGRTPANVSGEKNPFFGKTHTPETREYLRQLCLGKLHPHLGDAPKNPEQKSIKCRQAAQKQWAARKADPTFVMWSTRGEV